MNNYTYISLHKPSAQITGSSLMGHVTCTHEYLVNLFGPSMIKTDGYKTSAEWHVEHVIDGVSQGVTAIYDYKQCETYCGEHGVPTELITEWNIGAKSKQLALDLKHFIVNPKTVESSETNLRNVTPIDKPTVDLINRMCE